ncbi:MAG: hypothetical protein K6G89_06130 [Clostridia bacterium]|nr:hypothetical protein [Clostridia bacterium]
MITEQETKRYEVSPERAIENSFSGAFDSISDEPVVSPPEKSVLVSSILSMLLISGMCTLTFVDDRAQIVWLIVGILAFAVIGFIVFRYIKALKKYEKATSQGSQRFNYKQEYVSLFPELPDRMNAGELTKAIAPMQNKQRRDVYNNAIRDLITKLNTVNNPSDVLCRNLSTYGNLFAQPRRRCYIKSEDSKIVIYDADFSAPRGELIIDPSDVLAYGEPDSFEYISEVKKTGNKISSDAILIAIKTDEEGGRLYIESHANDLLKLKKILGKSKLN